MAERNMNDDFVYRNQVGTAIDQLRLALKTADTGERIRLLNGACRTRAMRSVSSPSSTRTARGGPHAVKSRVRTIMLNRRVYRVAMQAKGGR